MELVGGRPSTPGIKRNAELNAQVISRKWYPSPRPAVDSTVSVVNGLHRANGSGEFQSGAITITAATRFLETLVMSHATLHDTETTATQLFSDGAREYVFTARTHEEGDPELVTFGGDDTTFNTDPVVTW